MRERGRVVHGEFITHTDTTAGCEVCNSGIINIMTTQRSRRHRVVDAESVTPPLPRRNPPPVRVSRLLSFPLENSPLKKVQQEVVRFALFVSFSAPRMSVISGTFSHFLEFSVVKYRNIMRPEMIFANPTIKWRRQFNDFSIRPLVLIYVGSCPPTHSGTDRQPGTVLVPAHHPNRSNVNNWQDEGK